VVEIVHHCVWMPLSTYLNSKHASYECLLFNQRYSITLFCICMWWILFFLPNLYIMLVFKATTIAGYCRCLVPWTFMSCRYCYFKEIMRTFLELSCACMNYCSHKCEDFARCDNIMYVYCHSLERLEIWDICSYLYSSVPRMIANNILVLEI
jgi:hypothetical protein